MASNTPFTHLIEDKLRQFVYGEITATRYVVTHCHGDTCRDWRPISSAAYNPSPWETPEAYERKFDWLVELEEDSRVCQGHLVKHETIRGMLRSFSVKAASDDRSRDGSLSITVLPWDEAGQRLTSSRVMRTRVFGVDLQKNSVYVTDGQGATALELELRPWRPNEPTW